MSKTDEMLRRIESDLDSQHTLEAHAVLENTFPGYLSAPDPAGEWTSASRLEESDPAADYYELPRQPTIDEVARALISDMHVRRLMAEVPDTSGLSEDHERLRADMRRIWLAPPNYSVDTNPNSFRVGPATEFAKRHGLSSFSTRTTSSRPVVERPSRWRVLWEKIATIVRGPRKLW